MAKIFIKAIFTIIKNITIKYKTIPFLDNVNLLNIGFD